MGFLRLFVSSVRSTPLAKFRISNSSVREKCRILESPATHCVKLRELSMNLSRKETSPKRRVSTLPQENNFLFGLVKTTVELSDYPIGAYPEAFRELVASRPGEDQLDILEIRVKRCISKESDETLVGFLVHLCEIRSKLPKSNYFKILNTIDEELTDRLKIKRAWNLEDIKEALFTSDLLYRANNFRPSSFIRPLSRIIHYHFSLLDASAFKHFLFLRTLLRIELKDTSAEVEAKLLSVIDEFSFDDVGLACAAFFKTQTKLQNVELIRKVLELTEANVTDLDESNIALSAIFKCLRYSHHMASGGATLIREFIVKWIDRRDELTLMSLVHLCKMTGEFCMYSDKLLITTLERITEALNNEECVRLKDIHVTLGVCADFQHRPDEAQLATIAHRLDTLEDGLQYPHSFLSLLCSLSSFGVYPRKAIELSVTKDFVDAIKDDSNKPKNHDFLLLNTSLALEGFPSEPSLRFSPDFMKTCEVNYSRIQLPEIMNKKTNKTHFESVFRKVYLGFKYVYHSQAVAFHTFPFMYAPDILILRSPEELVHIKSMKLEPGAANGCTVVVILNVSSFSDPRRTVMTGLVAQKIRLLKAFGYHVITVPYYDVVDKDYTPQISKKLCQLTDIPVISNFSYIT